MDAVRSAWDDWLGQAGDLAQLARTRYGGGGPKGPPSAPPTIPPIIINPFSYQTPAPAIDPRVTPVGPPLAPPPRPPALVAGALS